MVEARDCHHAVFEPVNDAKSFPVPECKRVEITVRNDTADIVGAHFVSYEGEEDDGCVLWLRPGQKKTVEWALGWVIRFRSHATKALLLELCVSEQRGTVFEHVTFPLHLTITAPDADSDAKYRWTQWRRVTKSELCEREGVQRYLCEDVPHGEAWLSGAGRTKVPGQAYRWCRLTDLPGGQEPVVFDGVEASDIKQGALGDCWLLSSLACLAEFPDLVRCLLVDERTEIMRGMFTFRLFEPFTDAKMKELGEPGQWHEITIDDYVPVYEWNLRPCFAKAFGNEMWVSLLEKAAAKLAGGYHMIGCGGETKVALETLTGDVTWSFSFVEGHWRGFKGAKKGLPTMDERAPYWPDRGEVRDMSSDEFWSYLAEGDSKGWIIAAGTAARTAGEETKGEDGLVYGHAYTVIECREVAGGPGGTVRLMRVRNPWGSFEWNGDWSDSSKLWDKYPRVKETIDPSLADDDGEFWMDFRDFQMNFSNVAVCEVGERRSTSSSVLFSKHAIRALKHDRLAQLAAQRKAGLLSRTVKLLVKKNKLVGGDGSDTPALSDKSRNTLSRAAAAARKRVQSRHAEAASGAEGETEVPGDSETVPLWREGTEKTQSGREMEAEAESKEEGVKVAPESKGLSLSMLLLAGFLWLAVTLVYLGRTDLLLAPIKSALQLLQNVEEDGEEVAEVVSSEDGTLAAEA